MEMRSHIRSLQHVRALEFFTLIYVLSAFLLALSVTMLLYSLSFRWPFFMAKKIEITGNSYLSTEYIRKLYALNKKWSIFELVGEREILDPIIKKVRVEIVSHDRLNFMIEERKMASIMHIGTDFYLSDAQGTLFRKLREGEDPYDYSLPVICGLNEMDFTFDKLSRNGLVKKLNYVINLDKTLIKNISEIDIKGNVVYMRKGIVFKVREIKDLQEIPDVILKIWKALPARSRVEMITNNKFVFER